MARSKAVPASGASVGGVADSAVEAIESRECGKKKAGWDERRGPAKPSRGSPLNSRSILFSIPSWIKPEEFVDLSL